MNIALVGGLAILFAVSHVVNSWVFESFEISPHVGLIYTPAFFRLFNVLILGTVKGSLATLIGGVLLMMHFNEEPVVGLLNVLCSLSGPLLALGLFQLHFKRTVHLGALSDLVILALVSCFFNTSLHHAVWTWIDPTQVSTPWQWLWMGLGDFAGCIIGVGLMKWAIDRFGLPPTAA